jgi:hypothetical protein
MMRNLLLLSLLGGLTLLSPAAHAGLLNVVNPSFETPALADGQSTPNGITGWVGAGQVDVPIALNPAAGVDTTTGIAPDGNNVGAAVGFNPPAGGPSDGAMIQTLTSTLTADTSYTLTVDVGQMLHVPSVWVGAVPAWNGYTVKLLAGNTVLAQDNNSVAVPVGGFALSTVSFTALPGNPLLGDPITIWLAAGSSVYPSVALFDNVQVNAAVVPEPSTFVLAALAVVIGAARFCRRSRVRIA